jgi:hypothetical protein
MLRFEPDSWLEGVLRPLLMIDPVAGLYLEEPAPDWRFAALAALMLILGGAALVRRRRWPLSFQQGVTALGLFFTFYLWTFASGNGRYLSWGLLLVGPLLVMAAMLLPVSRSLRWSALSLVLTLQVVALHFSNTSNPWAVVRVTDTLTPLQASPLRDKPAVFLTASVLSYSILVPLFHPASRWANIAGQYNVLPGTVEWSRLQSLLQSPLPLYLVTAVGAADHDALGQPTAQTAGVLQGLLIHHGLSVAGSGCQMMISSLSSPGTLASGEDVGKRGFLVCPLTRRQVEVAEHPPADPQPQSQLADAKTQALDAVEQRCPRFFPATGRRNSLLPGVHARQYAATDVRLWVEPEGMVMYQYFRAMNPTLLGSVDEVRAGRFSLPCGKLPGRYVPFWQRP